MSCSLWKIRALMLTMCVYDCSKKIRIHAKLNDVYLNLPESLLDVKPMAAATPALTQPSAGVPQLLAAEETPATSKDVVLGGHEVPTAPGTLRVCVMILRMHTTNRELTCCVCLYLVQEC